MRSEAGASQPATSSQSTTGGQSDFVRLHITPFDQDLLKIVLPTSILPSARNISFHTLETFPEKRYGFVELPPMEAEKVKKKLNGTVLKGTKVKVDKARPEVEIVPTGDADAPEKKRKKRSKEDSDGSKKRKRDPDVIEGVSLNDRKVKRGWTEVADHKRKKKSKKDEEGKTQEKRKRLKSIYTEQEECLLKTKVPANATANLPQGEESKRKKKRGKGREVTVHEFEKTTKFPSFLKAPTQATDNNKPAVEFVEGKGWIDAEGNVVEVVKEDTRKITKPRSKKVEEKKPVVESDDDSTSSSGTSSGSESDEEEEDDSEEEEEEEEEESTESQEKTPQKKKEDKTAEFQVPALTATPTSAIKADPARPISSSSSRSLTIKIPPPITPSATKVHPLEALYKRQEADDETATRAQAQDAPFSFFGGANEEDEESREQPSELLPMTPYSRQDFEWRNIRSAAPTPDTAHPSRMRIFWAPDDGDEDMDEAPEVSGNAAEANEEQQIGEEDAEDDIREDAPAQGQPGTSDFQDWFWENRRDLNRSWMTRRKTAAKEKRHRENKSRASKAI